MFDQADIGLLLVGTSALARGIDPQNDPLIGPLVSRIALRLDLDAELFGSGLDGKARPWIDTATVAAIVARAVTVTPDREALALLTATANTAPGHLRTALNAIRVASILRRGDGDAATISAADVRAALQLAGRQA